jgi:membrane peptidoglycan carboxypeptidase
MDKETLRMQMLAGVITESEYAAAINKEVEETEKNSLNESMIGGIVGIGAINQIPSRAKADYEDAFEHFLGQKYELKEEESVEEDLNEADAIAIKKIDDKIQNDPEFLKKTKEAMAKAEKGNTTDLASLMAGFGKMFEADELEEGKEVEEKTNY